MKAKKSKKKKIRRKKEKRNQQKVDYISELPDCVLSYILSMVSMKDLMNTCVLSKRWSNLWHLRRNLNFDLDNVLGSKEEIQKYNFPERRDEFIRRVDQFVKNLEGIVIDSFMLDVYYDIDSKVDEWIRFAIARGVGRINLYREWHVNKFKFPFGLSFECNNSTLKHMYLKSCDLVCPPTNFDIFPFTNLRSLELDGSKVDVKLLTTLLSNCLLLEELSLVHCDLSSSTLKLVSSSLCHLTIEECHNDYRDLHFISMDCPKLTSLHYNQIHRSATISMNTRILKTIYYFDSFHPEKLDEAFALFATLPKLEILNLYNSSFGRPFHLHHEVNPLQGIQTLKNLRQFNWSIYGPKKDIDIWWILPILQASPFLQKLSIIIRYPLLCANQRDNQDLIMFSLGEIKAVELGGCVGNWYENEFAMNALKYFHKLEQIVLSPHWTNNSFSTKDGKLSNPKWFEDGRERILGKLQGEGIELDKLILV